MDPVNTPHSKVEPLSDEARSSLTELQYAIAAQLRQRKRLSKIPDAVELAELEIAGNDRLQPAEQLEIYRRQFWLRHTQSLLEDFPGVSGILGQREWEALTESYLREHAPTSFTLRDLGDRFAQHLESRLETPHHELCLDMARLEWCYVELFDAAEAPPLDPGELATIPDEAWPEVRVVPSPTLRLLRTRYPVAELRKTLRKATQRDDAGTAPTAPPTGEAAPVPIPEPAPSRLALYRDAERQLRYLELGEAAFTLLEELASGKRLQAACEATAERVPESRDEIEARIGEWFHDWSKRRWIAGVVSPDV